MKKAIIAMFAIALAPLAFAITESQKNAFVDKLDNVFVPAQKANDALGADTRPFSPTTTRSVWS